MEWVREWLDANVGKELMGVIGGTAEMELDGSWNLLELDRL